MKPSRKRRRRATSHRRLTRREALKLGASSVAALSAFEMMSSTARAQVAPPAEKLLFVFTATGGGSIVDSFFAGRETDVANAGGSPLEKLCFPDSTVSAFGGVNGGGLSDPTAIRALDLPDHMRLGLTGTPGTPLSQSAFVQAHYADMAVMAMTGTSVNHFVAQARMLNGLGVNGGRTIGEAVAERHGQSLALPFLNMGTGGYLENGVDDSVPTFARGEPVAVPTLFASSTDSMRGVIGAPGGLPAAAPQIGDELDRARDLMARARSVREAAEQHSAFVQTYQCSDLYQQLKARRAFAQNNLEPQDLISNLLFLTDPNLNLGSYGLELSPAADTTVPLVELMSDGTSRNVFFDPFLAQVVLAYLATRYGYTTAVNLGPTFNTDINNLDVNPPLSFDNSHATHVVAQQQMWSRVLDGVDKLIRLLKMTSDGAGGTLWDRSLIYIASDFGRDKIKSTPQLFSDYETLGDGGIPDGFNPQGTGHHLNNGACLISPLLNGGRVYGGIDYAELLTHGFDRNDGTPLPTSTMYESDVYSVICQALGVDFVGRQDIPVMVAS